MKYNLRKRNKFRLLGLLQWQHARVHGVGLPGQVNEVDSSSEPGPPFGRTQHRPEVLVEQEGVLVLHPLHGPAISQHDGVALAPDVGEDWRRERDHDEGQHAHLVVVRLVRAEPRPVAETKEAVAMAQLVAVARRPRRRIHLEFTMRLLLVTNYALIMFAYPVVYHAGDLPLGNNLVEKLLNHLKHVVLTLSPAHVCQRVLQHF